MRSPIKIGTRGSPLAMYQAELVCAKLKTLFPLVQFELVKIHTKGDMIRRGSAAVMGERIFTHEIEQALLAKEIDLGVHSAKDLASELPAGLEIAAILEREDSRDCLVAREGMTLATLKPGAKIGTGSLRRRAQLNMLRSDLDIMDLRGNIETRIRKTSEGIYDGIVLAHAGLKRLSMTHLVTEVFDQEQFLPQAAQGAIAVETREDDYEIRGLVKPTSHSQTLISVTAERSFLGALGGGCQVPVGVASKIESNQLMLTGAVFSLDGSRKVASKSTGAFNEASSVGKKLADEILSAGGREILEEIRRSQG